MTSSGGCSPCSTTSRGRPTTARSGSPPSRGRARRWSSAPPSWRSRRAWPSTCPCPRSLATGARRRRAPRGRCRPAAARRRRSRRPRRPRPATAGAASAAAPEPPAEELEALRAQLAGEQATVRRLTTALEDAQQGLAAARASADDHDALERERDAAVAARDEALARSGVDHDAVIEERDLAVHERSAALYERDEALDERAAANFERKNAIAERDAAFAERDRAVEAHRAAVHQLEELERRMAEAQQARVEAIPAPAPPVGAVRATPGERPDERQRPGLVWAQRAVALIVLVVWAIVVYKVLHGLV